MPNTKTKSKANQPGRIKRAVRWLKPTSPLKGMVLFALIFGVIAGGYYAYQSFASGGTSLLPGKQIFPNNATSAYLSTDCNGDRKGCISVLKLPDGSSGTARFTIPDFYPRSFYICVSIRAQVTASKNTPVFALSDISSSFVGNSAYIFKSVPKNTLYHEDCTGETLKPGIQTIVLNMVNVHQAGYSTSDVYIPYIALRWP